MNYHEDRVHLADAIGKLAPFIQQRTGLLLLKCQVLAMAIVNDSERSGVVSTARAIQLLEEAS